MKNNIYLAVILMIWFLGCIPVKKSVQVSREKFVIINNNQIITQSFIPETETIRGLIILGALNENTNIKLTVFTEKKQIVGQTVFVKPKNINRYQTIKFLFPEIYIGKNKVVTIQLQTDNRIKLWYGDVIDTKKFRLENMSYNGTLYLEYIYNINVRNIYEAFKSRFFRNRQFAYIYFGCVLIVFLGMLIVLFNKNDY